MLIPEDYTTFTEVDPASHITVASNRITVANYTRNEEGYVYKDMGVDYFDGDFVHYLTIHPTSYVLGAYHYMWMLSNTLDDGFGIRGAGGKYISLSAYWSGATGFVLVLEEYNGSPYSDYYSISTGTTYYTKIVRNESVGTYGTIYCYIYSDQARTNLLDTLALALHEKVDFRYLYGINTYNDAVLGTSFNGYVEDLYLGKIIPSSGVPSKCLAGGLI